jgi:hypothetical protein
MLRRFLAQGGKRHREIAVNPARHGCEPHRGPKLAGLIQEVTMGRSLLLVLMLVLTSQAQDPRLFVSGSMRFDYDQLFGNFDGTFDVSGEIDTTDFTPTFDAGVGGLLMPDSTAAEQLLCFAVEAVPEDTTWNVFGLWLRSPEPLQPGPVPNPASNANLFLIWHLDSLVLPSEIPDSLDIASLLGALVADYKLLGAVTSMSVTGMEEGDLSFSFAGSMIELDNPFMIVNVSGGLAELNGLPMVGVDDVALRPRSPALQLAPNPFNPSTRLLIQLERPGPLRLEAHDLLGRRIDELDLGPRPAGRFEMTWSPPVTASSGMYLLRLTQEERLVGQAEAIFLK